MPDIRRRPPGSAGPTAQRRRNERGPRRERPDGGEEGHAKREAMAHERKLAGHRWAFEPPGRLLTRHAAVFVASGRKHAGPVRRQRFDVIKAEPTGRRALDPLYADVIVQRFEKF